MKIKQHTAIDGTNVCNTFVTELYNHCGTHYDAPWHFNAEGPKITELPFEYFWFEKVYVIDLPKKPDEGITPDDLKPYEEEIKKADLLLIKTGQSYLRREQPEMYQQHGSYLTPEVCAYMVETFPDLKTVGFDFLSIGSPANDLSAKAHQTLLGCYNGRYITAIEDMDLMPLYETDKKVTRVIAAPLRIVEIDSSQVCVIAEFED